MTPLETAQKASELTDRALFICIIIIIGTAFAYVLRATAKYFIKQHEIVVEAHFKERERCQLEVKILNDERKSENAAVVKCLEANTASTRDNTEMLKRVNDRLLERK